jgi:hypothetical protein
MHTKKWLGALVGLAVWLSWPGSAVGDGMFFPPVAVSPVDIPDQQALIGFKDGVETLVIDTAFRGAGGEFAWVVPLPAKPEISPATPGLFTTLQILCAPKIVAHEPDWRVFFLVAGVALLGSILALRRGARISSVVIVWVVMLLLCGVLLPGLVTAGVTAGNGGATEAGEVTVLDRKTVGVFDTVTLASAQGEAVFAWLKSNGFQTPPEAAPVLAAYASNGWVFVASRLSTTASSNQVRRAHPLCFKFRTARPVYPLRLTGVRNPPLKVDLYVFGAERAVARNFAVEVCAPTVAEAPPLSRRSVGRGREVPVVHPELRELVGDATVATKLSATLSPAQMAEDAWIEWQPFEPTWTTLYTEEVVRKMAWNKGSLLLMTGWVFCFGITCMWRQLPWRFLLVSSLVVLAVALFVGLNEWNTQPRVAGVWIYRSNGWSHQWEEAEQLFKSVTEGVPKPVVHGADPLVGVRTWLAGDMRSLGYASNPYTGKPPQEDASPGNYVVRSNATGLEIVWYNHAGAERCFPLTGLAQPATNTQPIRP